MTSTELDALVCPIRGIMRGIFGDEMPAGKGGPDKDSKLVKITVGELRQIHAAIITLRKSEDELREALKRIADPRNIHFAGDAQVVARQALSNTEDKNV